MAARFSELIVDAADPEVVADFWAAVLDWRRTGRYDDAVEIADPTGARPSLVFLAVPEPKAVKNRLHLDLNPAGGDQGQELERLLALGAVRTDVGQGAGADWVVLADPEGNEFCLLRARAD
ncbi:MAG: VOC family protein [Actinobacteria bacterium]|nr:VOC family protein [Actinomycetota bacterium]